jgi:hypothetical protein
VTWPPTTTTSISGGRADVRSILEHLRVDLDRYLAEVAR